MARCALLGGSLLFTLGIVETYFRIRFPFGATAWPGEFDVIYGWRFSPGETVRHTNWLDYATETPINSLGFLDREPPVARADDEFRIVVLGDSFVEAAQVAIDDKFHVVLEDELEAAAFSRPVRTQAFGYSGCGTSNVIPYYREFGRALQPDVVVVLFVSNDLANNSPLLESVRNGWHPYKPPRLFYEWDGKTAREVPIVADWSDHVLPVEALAMADPGFADTLLGWSRTWTFASAKLGRSRVIGSYRELLARRCDHLRSMDEDFAGMLDGLDPRVDDLDFVFYAEDLPKVCEMALGSTRAAFEELKRECAADGAELVVVLHEGCSGSPGLGADRKAIPNGYRDRVVAAADAVGVKTFDLAPVIDARGARKDAHFPHDGHWSAQGHRWVAEGLAEFFVSEYDAIGATPR